jgi:hypothetical protein
MRASWDRRGLLISTPTPQSWAHSHAALPFAEYVRGELDLYYSPRDELGRAHVAVAHIDVREPAGDLVLRDHRPEPVLSPGATGAFDESGTTVSCIVHVDDTTFLYYTGWTLGVTVPFYFYAGLAIRRTGETAFTRASTAPLLERNAIDPYLTASPWVIHENGVWQMWYVSCCDWQLVADAPRHRYHIRYAESGDGVAWMRDGRVSIDFADDSEYAMGRPCVVRDDDCYRMWFTVRGSRYRLGYAESADGLTWVRDDRLAGLEPSGSGWDSEMIAYPTILDHSDRRYLFYNGNDYGRTGIGYAVQTGARHPSRAPALSSGHA